MKFTIVVPWPLAAGLALLAAGLLWGEDFGLRVSHGANASIAYTWHALVSSLHPGSLIDVQVVVSRVLAVAAARSRSMSVHSHLVGYGVLIALVILTERRAGPQHAWSTFLLIAGALAQSLNMLNPKPAVAAGFAVSDVGAVLLLTAIAAKIRCLIRPAASYELPARLQNPEEPATCDITVLRAGTVLAALGLCFGLINAALNLTVREPALQSSLLDLSVSLAEGRQAAAVSALEKFESVQKWADLMAAAHSHAVNLGLVLVILGFSMAIARTSAATRTVVRWLAIVGAFGLPVGILLAVNFGYQFGLLADAAGGLVILALTICITRLLVAPATDAKFLVSTQHQGRRVAVFTLAAFWLCLAGSLLWTHLNPGHSLYAEREKLISLPIAAASVTELSQSVRSYIDMARAVHSHAHFLYLLALLLAAALLMPVGPVQGRERRIVTAALCFAAIAYPTSLILDRVPGSAMLAHTVAAASSFTIFGLWMLISYQTLRTPREDISC